MSMPNATPPAAPPEAPPAPPAPPATPPPEQTFTQAELDKYAGRRAAEAKREAEKTLAETLGVAPAEAAKIIGQHQAAQEAAKTDVEKAKEAEAAANARAAAAEAKAAEATFEGRVKDHLVAAGVIAGFDPDKDEDRKAATTHLARARRLLDLDPDATDDDIAAKVAEIKADIPGLFGVKAAAGAPPSGVTAGKPPTGGPTTASGMDAGRQRAKNAKPEGQPTDPLARWAKT